MSGVSVEHLNALHVFPFFMQSPERLVETYDLVNFALDQHITSQRSTVGSVIL